MTHLPDQPLAPLVELAHRSPTTRALLASGADLDAGQLLAAVGGLAGLLAERGVAAGHRVCLGGPPAFQAASTLALFACCAQAGVSPRCGADVGVDFDWHLDVVRHPNMAPAQMIVVDDATLNRDSNPSATTLAPYPDPTSICRIVFSSGTTGTPRPMGLSVGALMARSRLYRESLMPHRPYFSLMPMSSSIGVIALVASLEEGVPYLAPGTPAENLAIMRTEFVGTVLGSVAQLEALCDAADGDGGDLGDVATIYSIGSATPPSLIERLHALSSAAVHSAYGATEVGPIAVAPAGSPRVFTPLGGEMTFEVLDEDGAPVASGQPGRLVVSSPTKVRGYLDAEATPFDAWFSTGDLATRQADGTFVLEGRAGDLLNVGGVKVDPVLVDDTVRALPGIVDAALVHLASDTGHGAVLAVVCRDDDTARVALGAATSASGGMAVRTVVRVGAIPRTEHGKVRRGVLATAIEEEFGALLFAADVGPMPGGAVGDGT